MLANRTPYWSDYKTWEYYNGGMYESRLDEKIVCLCADVLSDPKRCYEAMKKTSKDYKTSTRIRFTNEMFNPVSWLGQAACNNVCGATAKETINAWLSMDADRQSEANRIANVVIREWQSENI